MFKGQDVAVPGTSFGEKGPNYSLIPSEASVDGPMEYFAAL